MNVSVSHASRQSGGRVMKAWLPARNANAFADRS
jgi:hypothetical protein